MLEAVQVLTRFPYKLEIVRIHVGVNLIRQGSKPLIDYLSWCLFLIKVLFYIFRFYFFTCPMKEITVEEFKQWLDEKRDFQLIDVREPYEHEAANLGGNLVPLATVPLNVEKIEKDKPVVIHCRSGARSANACQFLEQNHGFDNVFNLKGGILAYKNAYDPNLQVS